MNVLTCRLDSYDIIGSEGQSSLVEEENVKERVEQTLWVEKYTPLHFTQLLSDDVSAITTIIRVRTYSMFCIR